MSRQVITRDSLLAAAKAGEQSPALAMLRKAVVAEKVEAIEGVDRTLQFTISTASVDRDRDTVNALGWQLENYKKNPVVLWAHDYSQLPVGKATKIGVDGGVLRATCEFAKHDFANTVFEMLKGGFLNATSVGFAPDKWSYNETRGGLDFEEQELLEFSIVPVPANPEALIEARAAGIDTAPLKAWAQGVIKGLKTVTPEERKAQSDTVKELEAAASALAQAEPVAAEEPKADEAAAPVCTACGKDSGDVYVKCRAVVLCRSCFTDIVPTKDGGSTGMVPCAFSDPADGTSCAATATENCTSCGAGMCGTHVHASGVCMACGSKAAAPEAEKADDVLALDAESSDELALDEDTEAEILDPEDLRVALASAVADSMGQLEQVVRAETAAAINRARGRVD